MSVFLSDILYSPAFHFVYLESPQVSPHRDTVVFCGNASLKLAGFASSCCLLPPEDERLGYPIPPATLGSHTNSTPCIRYLSNESINLWSDTMRIVSTYPQDLTLLEGEVLCGLLDEVDLMGWDVGLIRAERWSPVPNVMAVEAFGFGFCLQAFPYLLLLQYLQGRKDVWYQDILSRAGCSNLNEFGVVAGQKHENNSWFALYPARRPYVLISSMFPISSRLPKHATQWLQRIRAGWEAIGFCRSLLSML